VVAVRFLSHIVFSQLDLFLQHQYKISQLPFSTVCYNRLQLSTSTMLKLLLLLSILVTIRAGDDDDRDRRHHGRPHGRPTTTVDPRRLQECYQILDVTTTCPVSEKPLWRQYINSTGQDFLTAVRQAGFNQLCNETGDLLQCVLNTFRAALRDCEFLVGGWLRQAIKIYDVYQSFQQEVCSPEFGNFTQHWNCFTNYDLLVSTLNCTSTITPDWKPDNYTLCVQDKMDKYPTICNRGAKDLAAKIIRLAFQKAHSFLRDNDDSKESRDNDFIKELLKF